MKKSLFIIGLLFLLIVPAKPQTPDPSFGIRLSGYVKTDVIYDTRQSCAANYRTVRRVQQKSRSPGTDYRPGIWEGHQHRLPPSHLSQDNIHQWKKQPLPANWK